MISNRKVHGMTNTYYSTTKMYPLEYFDTMPRWKLTDIAKVLRIKGSRKLKKRQLVDTIFKHHETQNVQLSCSLETKEQILRCKHIVSHIKSFLFYKNQSEFDLHWRLVFKKRIRRLVKEYTSSLNTSKKRDLHDLYDNTLSIVGKIFEIKKRCSRFITKPHVMYHVWHLYNFMYKPRLMQCIRYNMLFYDPNNIHKLLTDNSDFVEKLRKLISHPRLSNQNTLIRNIYNSIHDSKDHTHLNDLIKKTNYRIIMQYNIQHMNY